MHIADMYGKLFASLYTGSMIGAGLGPFAVWPYVIANMVPDREVGTQVDLNPKLIAMVIGTDECTIEKAIDYLCRPDLESRTESEQGRRLIKIGHFTYRVVNGDKYRKIRDEEQRRQQNREAKQRERAKHSKPLPGEKAFVEAQKNGANIAVLDKLSEP